MEKEESMFQLRQCGREEDVENERQTDSRNPSFDLNMEEKKRRLDSAWGGGQVELKGAWKENMHVIWA